MWESIGNTEIKEISKILVIRKYWDLMWIFSIQLLEAQKDECCLADIRQQCLKIKNKTRYL